MTGGCVRGPCAIDHLRYRGHVFPLVCNINKTQISCWSRSRPLQIIWKPGLTHLQVHFHSNICMKDFLPCYKYPFGPCPKSLKNEIWTPTLNNSFFVFFSKHQLTLEGWDGTVARLILAVIASHPVAYVWIPETTPWWVQVVVGSLPCSQSQTGSFPRFSKE